MSSASSPTSCFSFRFSSSTRPRAGAAPDLVPGAGRRRLHRPFGFGLGAMPSARHPCAWTSGAERLYAAGGVASRILDEMSGTMGLFARLLYGTGMRLREGLHLRVKDLDFDRREITVRQGAQARDLQKWKGEREDVREVVRPPSAACLHAGHLWPHTHSGPIVARCRSGTSRSAWVSSAMVPTPKIYRIVVEDRYPTRSPRSECADWL